MTDPSARSDNAASGAARLNETHSDNADAEAVDADNVDDVDDVDEDDVETTVSRALRELRRISIDDPVADQEDAEDEDRGDGTTTGDGLGRLVLTLVKLIHELLEKQAIRRMDAGTLTDDEVERVGRTLMRQSEEIERLCDVFGLDPDDLDIPLGTVSHLDD